MYRKGIINVSSSGKETFGVLDELGYGYEGNQLFSIDQLNQGIDFYGRTGYAPTSGTYTWNEAGLLNSDSSRGILSTTHFGTGSYVTKTKSDTNPLTGSEIPVEEMNTIGITGSSKYTENKLREENGLPKRIDHKN